LFVIGLDQDYFKNKLTPILGQRDWPEYDALSQELHTYVESRRHMQIALRDKSGDDMKVEVHRIENPSTYVPGCWNCGSTEHHSKDCSKKPAVCNKCDQTGHMAKYCKSVQQVKQRNQEKIAKNDQKIKPYQNYERGSKT